MINRYRLASTVYDRETEEDKIALEKVIFLSVEGNISEKEYFEGVSKNRELIGINAKIDVEVLRRGKKDNKSAPIQVIELLEEYIRLREQNEDDMLEEISEKFKKEFSIEFIKSYLNDPDKIPKKQRNVFVTELAKIGYDINYRKYLKKYNGKYDEFAVLIDRDMNTHSEINMIKCINYCREKKYSCYIANPCFEFWLLLHLSDVKEEYKNSLDDIKKNEKVTDKHTYVSKEVSKKAGHGKSGINFVKNYMHKIDLAIERAKQFAYEEEELIDNIGCNLWKLIEHMRVFEDTEKD